jgi:hypothetical protein
MDHWHAVSGKLRRAIKGWGQNFDSQQKRYKQQLLKRIADLDDTSETRALVHIEWKERYDLEVELQSILIDDEKQRQRKGGERWMLEGDSNTS